MINLFLINLFKLLIINLMNHCRNFYHFYFNYLLLLFLTVEAQHQHLQNYSLMIKMNIDYLFLYLVQESHQYLQIDFPINSIFILHHTKRFSNWWFIQFISFEGLQLKYQEIDCFPFQNWIPRQTVILFCLQLICPLDRRSYINERSFYIYIIFINIL